MRHGNLQKYQNSNPWQKLLIHRFKNNVCQLIGDLKIENLLDVGCGEGYVLEFLKQKLPRVKMAGLDWSKPALTLAQKTNRDLEFIPGDACRLKMPNDSFDLVLCLEVIEHIGDYSQAISELARVARRHCLISVPWEPFFSLMNFFRLKHLGRLGRDPEHINFFSRQRIKNAVNPYLKIEKMTVSFPWIILLTQKTVHDI